MDRKCFHCGQLGAYESPEYDGHFCTEIPLEVGKGLCMVSVYPALIFDGIKLCDNCKEELGSKIIEIMAEKLERLDPREID